MGRQTQNGDNNTADNLLLITGTSCLCLFDGRVSDTDCSGSSRLSFLQVEFFMLGRSSFSCLYSSVVITVEAWFNGITQSRTILINKFRQI